MNDGGFTLLELVLVLLLIGMVLAMAAPSLRGFFASRQTADATMKVLSLTQWARGEAIASGQRCRLNFDPDGRSCWVSRQRAGTFEISEGRTVEMSETDRISLKSDLVDPSATYVQFYPSGRSDTAAMEIAGRQGTFIVANAGPTEPFRISEGEVSP
jgi:prepilin-type N-terminal cleavage/methylation domain-containing protein